MGCLSRGAILHVEAHAETAHRSETVLSDGSMRSTLLPGFTPIIFRRTSQLQHSFSKSICNPVDGLQQAVVNLSCSGLVEEIGLHWLRLNLLPAADAHPDEPHRLARQISVEKQCSGLAQDHPFVVSRGAEFVLTGVGLETCEADLQRHH